VRFLLLIDLKCLCCEYCSKCHFFHFLINSRNAYEDNRIELLFANQPLPEICLSVVLFRSDSSFLGLARDLYVQAYFPCTYFLYRCVDELSTFFFYLLLHHEMSGCSFEMILKFEKFHPNSNHRYNNISTTPSVNLHAFPRRHMHYNYTKTYKYTFKRNTWYRI